MIQRREKKDQRLSSLIAVLLQHPLLEWEEQALSNSAVRVCFAQRAQMLAQTSKQKNQQPKEKNSLASLFTLTKV
jgi:hypothetical protein